MEYIENIKNAFNYVISDSNKLIKLFLPNLIFSLLLTITLVLFVYTTNSYSYSNNPASAIVGLGIFTIVLFIIGLFVGILDCGIMISVIKNTLKGKGLPEFNIGTFFVDGIKFILVYFLYSLIPLIILMVFLGLGSSVKSDAIITLGSLIYYIFLIIINLILPVVLGKLAETDSVGEALSVGKVWETTKNIGLAEIFVLLLLTGVILTVFALIGTLLTVIPIIGLIISVAIYTFMTLFMARIYGLIYLEQDNQNTQQYVDFQQQGTPNYQQNQNTVNTKECPFCGQHNNLNANQCIYCGNHLQTETSPIYNNLNENIDYEGKIKCPECATENNKNSKYCEKCGSKLENTLKVNNICKNCGSPLDDNSLFCENCGTKKEN